LSENTPSTPRRKNCWYSAIALPYSAGFVLDRSSRGRKLFSLRNVYATNVQAGDVRVADERRQRLRAPAGVARDDVVLRGTGDVGVLRHLSQAGGRGHVAVGRRAARGEHVPGLAGLRVEELDERDAGQQRAQRLEVRDLEGLDGHLPVATGDVVATQGLDEGLLERQAERAEVRRVLELRDEPDPAMQLARELVAQVDDLLERRDRVAAIVERVALAQVGQALLRPQRLELGEREVLGEPVVRERDAVDDLRRAASGELGMVGDVGSRPPLDDRRS
jgi:hypothetical protein